MQTFVVIVTETSQMVKSMGNVFFSILHLVKKTQEKTKQKTKWPKQIRQNRPLSPMPDRGQPMFCRILQHNPSTF